MTQTFTAIVHKEDKLYVAECYETGTASQGETIEKALENLKPYVIFLWIRQAFLCFGETRLRRSLKLVFCFWMFHNRVR